MRVNRYIFLALFLVAGVGVNAQQISPSTSYLDIGSKISQYPNVEWLKGEGVTNFDPHKIYIVELWATWCVPCIKAMPHLVQLAEKFKEKKVVFITQDVMEENRQKVLDFISNHPEMSSFYVGYSGAQGSDFDKRWVKAAGVSSIPQTFIIQNNSLVWQTMPDKLNDQVLQLLIDGKFSIDAAEALSQVKN
jgi:thiol-disulfide isomerase/thioredoxin